ncbi:MAG: hypothetical protein ACW967_02335 [Candidatus Hodarchaeales archaeon]|jgi:hypothetical protein
MSEKIIFSPIEKEFNRRWNSFTQIKNQGKDGFKSVDLKLTSSLEDRIIYLLSFKSDSFIYHFSQLKKRNLTRFQIAHELNKSLISGTFGKFTDFEILNHGINLILTLLTNGKFSPRQSPFEVSIEGERKHIKVLFYSKYILEISSKTVTEIIILIEILIQNIFSSSDNRYNATRGDIQNILDDCWIFQPSTIWNNEEESIRRFLGLISFQIDSDTFGSLHSNLTEFQAYPSKTGLRSGLYYILHSLFSEKTYFLQLVKSILLTKWYFIFEPKTQHNKLQQVKNSFLEENLVISPTYSPLNDELSQGGFEIYFGKVQNTGYDIVGVSPYLFKIFPSLYPGSQIKLEGYSSTFSIAPVDNLPSPLVILNTKELIRYDSNVEEDCIVKIHSLGGLLVDHSIINNFNQELKMINDWEKWLNQLTRKQFHEIITILNTLKFQTNEFSALNLKRSPNTNSTVIMEHLINNNLPLPYVLLPKWKTMSIKQLKLIIDSIVDNKDSKIDEFKLIFDDKLIDLLYEGHIPFNIEENRIILQEYNLIFKILKKDTHSFQNLINDAKNENKIFNFYKFLKENLNIIVSYRNPFLGAILTRTWSSSLIQDFPKKFGVISQTQLKNKIDSSSALNTDDYYLNEQTKGEIIKKSFLRKKYNISLANGPVFNFQLPNAGLSHFKPVDIGTSLKNLKELGYRVDINGKPLKNEGQVLSIFVNDILVPKSIFKTLKQIYNFLDEELQSIFDQKPFFEIQELDDLTGTFLVGCNPNYSTGVIGRVIGWSDAKFNSDCTMAHPLWHGSKYSNCRNDEPDFLFVLEDLLLNFNLALMPSKINSLLGKPIFIKKHASKNDISVDLEHYLDKISKKESKISISVGKDILPSSYFVLIDFYNSLQSKHHLLSSLKPQIQLDNEFNKQMPLELSPIDFDLIEKNFNLFSRFYFGNVEFIKKLYFDGFIFPRFNAQLDLWLEQSIECPKCGSPYPYAVFKNCPSCNQPLALVYTKEPIMKQYLLIKDLMNRYPSQSLGESFYYLKNQFKLLFPSEKKMSILD